MAAEDFVSPALFVGAAIPVLALHSYLVAPRKKKSVLLRTSLVASLAAVVMATLWIWSIESDSTTLPTQSLAAGICALIAAGGILAGQFALLGIDLMIGSPKRRSYLT